MEKLIYRDSNGDVINIGEWDARLVHKKNPDADNMTMGEAKIMRVAGLNPEYLYDSEGNPIVEETNPLPEGATSRVETIIQRADGGLAAQSHYQSLRSAEYPSVQDQLDYIYHNGIEAWKVDMIGPIKNKYPKI